MKRRVRRPFLNVVKMILVLFLSVLIVTLSIFIYNLLNKTENPPVIQEEQNTYAFTLIDYEVYLPEEVDFGFVIAEINVSSNVPINLGLDVLSTSDGLLLSKTDAYLTQLQSANLKPGTHNLSFTLSSNEKDLRAYIFIPFLKATQQDTLTLVSSMVPFNQLTLNLKDTTKFGNLDLIKQANTVSTLENDLSIQIEYVDLFDPSNFYTLDANGQSLTIEFSSQDQIYGISILTNNASLNAYKVSDAKLIIDGVGEYGLLNPDILLSQTTNLTKLTLLKENHGFVFFALPSDQIKLLSYDSTKVHLALSFVSGEEIIIREILKK